MRKKHSGGIVSEKNLEIPIDSFKEKLELCRYNWKLWIDRDYIDKKTGLHNSRNTFSLSNSVPGRSSAFMFELCPNYRGTQSQASNSLNYVIGSIDAVLLMGLFHSLKNVVESGGISPY